VSLALGDHFACGLDAQGLARCWGSMIAPPPGPFRQLAAGRQRVCGLRFSGAVECWAYGAIVSPPPFADFVSVATSRDTCGLRRDGSVACWGGGESEPSPPGRFTAFAMADANVCGVRIDGTAGCWTGKRQPVEPRTPERFKDVAVGYGQLCGRRADNTVACSTPDAPRGLVPPPAAKLVQIAGDGETFCGVREDGGIDCWGDPWPGRALAGEPARMLTFRQFLSDLAARIGPPALEPDAALGGRVVDEVGRPLAGAEVMLCRGDQPFGTVIWRARTTPGTLSELARAAAATPSATSPGSYMVVTTGADGRWAARLPPHPSYVLPLRAVITAPRREIVERSEQQLWLGSMRADIPLRPASSLDVEPICDGIPCDGEITVSAGRHEGFRGRHIERLVPATYTVDVSAGRNVRGERRGTVVVDVTYTPAALRVAVALHAPGTGTSIRGIVSPPGGSSRRVTARCGDSDDAVYRSAQTDASGEFELRDVGPPPCFVDVDGLRSVTQRVETVPAEGIELRQN
jgi:hypothetical protein